MLNSSFEVDEGVVNELFIFLISILDFQILYHIFITNKYSNLVCTAIQLTFDTSINDK